MSSFWGSPQSAINILDEASKKIGVWEDIKTQLTDNDILQCIYDAASRGMWHSKVIMFRRDGLESYLSSRYLHNYINIDDANLDKARLLCFIEIKKAAKDDVILNHFMSEYKNLVPYICLLKPSATLEVNNRHRSLLDGRSNLEANIGRG